MGTRSLTYVYNDGDKPEPIVCMYRQFDGYPEGHGAELAEFLVPFTIINGIGSNQNELGKFANGMGCLAAQLVSHFKDSVGGIYMHVVDLNQDAWQEYEYHVYADKVEIKDPSEVIFSGTYAELKDFCCELAT